LSLIGVIATLVVGFQVAAFGVLTGSNFQGNDGNLTPLAQPTDPPNATPAGSIDWNSFAPVNWLGDAPYREADKNALTWQFKGIEDDQVDTADTAYAGGTKQDDDCATVVGAKAPNKDDLSRIYLSSSTRDVSGSDHTFLNLGWVRIPQNTTSPSAHIGFEFNQGALDNPDDTCFDEDDPDADPPYLGTETVKRQAGDLLFVYDFEGGSTTSPSITVREWVLTGACEVSNQSAPCWGEATNLSTLGHAEARVNTFGSVTDLLAPPNPPATASVSETLQTNRFGEASIDLTAAGVFDPNACESFGTASAVSRSSGNSGTAQMKDLAGPAPFNLQNCGTVNIIKETEPPESDQDFAFTSGSGDPATGVLEGDCSIGATEETDPSTFDLNASSDDTDSLNCVNVPAGTYTVSEGADPTGWEFDNFSCVSTGTGTSTTPTSSTTQKNVGITLAGGGEVTCTYLNNQQEGAILITKTGKDKSVAGENDPLAGATFSVTGPSPSTDPVTGSPFTTDANGEVCVDGLAFGDYSVTETGAPAGYAIDDPAARTVTVDTNATCEDATYVGESSAFTDTPLTDLTLHVESRSDGGGGTGATESSISCVDASDADIGDSPQPDASDLDGFANPVEVTTVGDDGLVPGTYTCTVVVDP
jgi:hypothetical protein